MGLGGEPPYIKWQTMGANIKHWDESRSILKLQVNIIKYVNILEQPNQIKISKNYEIILLLYSVVHIS